MSIESGATVVGSIPTQATPSFSTFDPAEDIISASIIESSILFFPYLVDPILSGGGRKSCQFELLPPSEMHVVDPMRFLDNKYDLSEPAVDTCEF